jgi:sugar/nucleoside kinase (ribokinase family)
VLNRDTADRQSAPRDLTTPQIDVVGIGNAIVDVLSHIDEAGLIRLGLPKGAMQLIDGATAEALYQRIGPAVECSGGSAANTIAGIASLGGHAAYVGKVRDDAWGAVFQHDLRALGVHYATAPASAGPATARCFVLVTPDGQRTMQTFLGISVELGPDDVPAALIDRAQVTYLEGYLFDPPAAQRAFRAAARSAHEAGRKVALSLSDSFCVERHRNEFRELIGDHVDILFANEHEVGALYQTPDFDAALQLVRDQAEIVVLTRGPQGSVIARGSELHLIDAAPVARVVDTTGAGDLYAAGFLFGLTHGYDLARCGRIGAIAAAEVISHFGARPERPLRELIEES